MREGIDHVGSLKRQSGADTKTPDHSFYARSPTKQWRPLSQDKGQAQEKVREYIVVFVQPDQLGKLGPVFDVIVVGLAIRALK